MPTRPTVLSTSHRDDLEPHRAILYDRARAIEYDLRTPALTADDWDDLADQAHEVVTAAQAIEVLCGRAAREARRASA